MYTITAHTEDGETVTFQCGASEDIITGALKQDVILLASCREGGCATCKAECADGEYELVNCSVQALPPDEEEDGFILLCRTFPRSDMTLTLPYTYERISFGKVNKDWAGEIRVCERISSNVARLVIRPLDADAGEPAKIAYAAGQFLDIEIPGTDVWRSYSMASISENNDLEFLIRILPDGRFSRFLLEGAKPGLRVRLRGPSGAFGIRENGFRPRLFVAGGTGLSPALSMIRYMRAERHPQETKLFFGVTHEHEVFYVDALREIEAAMPNLEVHVAVVNAEASSGHAKGTVVDLLSRHLESATRSPDIYLCGPPGMIDATFAAARKYGVPADHVFEEKFLPTGRADSTV
jgi:methane monooxygenase component C